MASQLDLGQKIIDFLQEKNDYNEHIIDEVTSGYPKIAIEAAILELSIADIVSFPNNDPMNWPAFFDERDSEIEEIEINYPILAKRIIKE